MKGIGAAPLSTNLIPRSHAGAWRHEGGDAAGDGAIFSRPRPFVTALTRLLRVRWFLQRGLSSARHEFIGGVFHGQELRVGGE